MRAERRSPIHWLGIVVAAMPPNAPILNQPYVPVRRQLQVLDGPLLPHAGIAFVETNNGTIIAKDGQVDLPLTVFSKTRRSLGQAFMDQFVARQ
jgi:hypothetical protein